MAVNGAAADPLPLGIAHPGTALPTRGIWSSTTGRRGVLQVELPTDVEIGVDSAGAAPRPARLSRIG